MANTITGVGATALAANTTLQSLNLRINPIGLAGAKALAANTTLTSIIVGDLRTSDHAIGGDEGLEALNKNRLDLALWSFGKASKKVTLLKDVIKNLKTFESVSFTIEGMEEVARQKRRAILSLSRQFHKAIVEFVDDDAMDMDTFKQKMEQLINTDDVKSKLEVLQKHRGIKKVILNLLLSIATLGIALIYSAVKGDYTLFNVNTNSKNSWNSLQDSLDESSDKKITFKLTEQ